MPQHAEDPIGQLMALRNYFRGATSLALSMEEPLKHGVMGPCFMPKTIMWEYDPEFRK